MLSNKLVNEFGDIIRRELRIELENKQKRELAECLLSSYEILVSEYTKQYKGNLYGGGTDDS